MKKYLVLLTLAYSGFSFAQTSEHRNWVTLNINQKINENFNVASDIQYRTYEDLDQLNQLLIRAGIGYNLNSNNNLLLGYAYVLTRNPIEENDFTTFSENRFYQQFNTKHKIDRINLNHRFRFEERLMKDDIFYRFRYQFTATLPLNNSTLSKNTFFVKAANELFLNAIKTNNFDRNRLNLGVGYVINSNYTVEAGYMKQHVQHAQTDHLTLGVTLNNIITKKPS